MPFCRPTEGNRKPNTVHSLRDEMEPEEIGVEARDLPGTGSIKAAHF